MIGGKRNIDGRPHLRDDVEIGHGGLDHDHVGTLSNVEHHFGQRFAGVVPVLLIALPVTAPDDVDIDGFAEGAVERSCILRRVGEDRNVSMAGRVESGTDRPDLAVHHSARSHDLGAGFGLGNSYARV